MQFFVHQNPNRSIFIFCYTCPKKQKSSNRKEKQTNERTMETSRAGDQVTLELFVGEEGDQPPPSIGSSASSSDTSAGLECLSLRILSRHVDFRFGGLQIHVRSPAFAIGKSFQVNLDQHNRISSIESYREPEPLSKAPSKSVGSTSLISHDRRHGRRLSLLGIGATEPVNPAKIAIKPPPSTHCALCPHCIAQSQLSTLQVDVLVEERSDSATGTAAAAAIATSIATSVATAGSLSSALPASVSAQSVDNGSVKKVTIDSGNAVHRSSSPVPSSLDVKSNQVGRSSATPTSGANTPHSYVQNLVSQLEQNKEEVDKNNNRTNHESTLNTNNLPIKNGPTKRSKSPNSPKSMPKSHSTSDAGRSGKTTKTKAPSISSTGFHSSSTGSHESSSRLSEFQAKLLEFEHRAKCAFWSRFRFDRDSSADMKKTKADGMKGKDDDTATIHACLDSSADDEEEDEPNKETNDKEGVAGDKEVPEDDKVEENTTSANHKLSLQTKDSDNRKSFESVESDTSTNDPLLDLHLKASGLTKVRLDSSRTIASAVRVDSVGNSICIRCARCQNLINASTDSSNNGDHRRTDTSTEAEFSSSETHSRQRHVGVGTALDHLLELDWPDARPMRIVRTRSCNQFE